MSDEFTDKDVAHIRDAAAVAEESGGKLVFRSDPLDDDVVEALIMRIEMRDPDKGLCTFAVYEPAGGDALVTLAVRLVDLETLVERARSGDAPTGDDVL
jgi:hypothetical protein